MVCVRVVQLVAVLACFAHAIPALGDLSYLLIAPQSPQLQIGTNFTATCFIKNTTEVTADDLIWRLGPTQIPMEQYRKINDTALNVTFLVTEETPRWLFCSSNKKSPHVQLNNGKYSHGIYLTKDYFPKKPKNLTCIAYQKNNFISPIIHCKWEPKYLQHWDFSTDYTLHLDVVGVGRFNLSSNECSADINTNVFPNFMPLDIWVEAKNALGKVESDHLKEEANSLIKTDPPSHINIISENVFPRSLLLNWTRPIDKTQLNLIYQVRFTSEGSENWSYVPQADTNFDIQSFRLQNLRPYTVYITQVRCKNVILGYWSDWSNSSSKRTPAYKPTSKPDVWQIVSESEASDGYHVQLLSKEPEFTNGKIIGYEIRIQDYKEKRQNNASEWETIQVTTPNTENRSEEITALKNVHLADTTTHIVKVVAVNSEGKSPEATIVIPEKKNAPAPVKSLKVSSEGGKLCVEWSDPNNSRISEYVVQWANHNVFDWQREKKNTRKANIRGNLQRFVRYNVSVYPLYSGWIGKPTRIEAYLEQGAPLNGPTKIISKPKCKEALLTWEEIPLKQQRGFITGYTIFYNDGTKTEAVTVQNDTFSYTLTNLARDTRYETWIMASTIKGSTNGSSHSFSTLKYAPDEIEGIVVAVSLCFLFVVVLAMLICMYKRDVIKKSFWPEIPNPGESTIGTWSPDYPVKAETPSESCLSGISVLDVDVYDGKSVFEEDKSCLPLKKDKYMSEEHSSGIGGSSCMSSPRQSVSDSDEGGDMADTTASTVQYSSVVASSGYKGQTPSLQPQQAVFSRSESTQPLLESEEHPDMLPLEGSRQSQRFHHLGLSHCEGNSDNPNQLEMEAKALDFCPVEEDSEEMSVDGQPDEWLASGPISSYMPQLGGYRQQ